MVLFLSSPADTSTRAWVWSESLQRLGHKQQEYVWLYVCLYIYVNMSCWCGSNLVWSKPLTLRIMFLHFEALGWEINTHTWKDMRVHAQTHTHTQGRVRCSGELMRHHTNQDPIWNGALRQKFDTQADFPPPGAPGHEEQLWHRHLRAIAFCCAWPSWRRLQSQLTMWGPFLGSIHREGLVGWPL